ncbi:hypothetical protein CPB85DRAFT_471302 [Mucidula mucida]|nr:hypothetical protein CPB85DRAFT_471302 [Mucidula mucida]
MVHYQELKGQRAPPLSLVDHNGQPFEFKPLEGALRTVLFFMSGFNTSSLKQVTLVQDLIEEREAAGKAKMQVLGVLNSARNPSKLADLAHGRGLTVSTSFNLCRPQRRSSILKYTLLNDPMGVARNAYGAVGERRLAQIVKKTFRLAPELWVDHVTFVIDERGVFATPSHQQ